MQENTDQKNTEYRNVIHSVFWHLKFHVRKKAYLGLMHKWHPLKIQNSKFKPFWDSLSPTLRHLRLKTPSWSITLNINLFLPRKRKHAHTHTYTHIHTLIRTTNVVPANSLFTGSGWKFFDLMLLMSRQEINNLSWKLIKLQWDTRHWCTSLVHDTD